SVLFPVFFLFRRPLISTLFPYTTLFRSGQGGGEEELRRRRVRKAVAGGAGGGQAEGDVDGRAGAAAATRLLRAPPAAAVARRVRDRKSTRLNSSHVAISYAVFCLKKKKQ